ncbi:hypothetical protein SteCoe_9595 [Stentor coeruleus]|uniref:Centrosomal protein of 70 kDa n=1 Tax=Stentor coeruleus TaxID=5963 RepID=A0A1R2CHN9_9CILI|nr:hypothetical protein SteCoe_9595 [Stentor coeruleus]
MSSTYEDKSISNCIKSVRSQMSKISSVYEESDTPLNQYLQEKYEKVQNPTFNLGYSYSNSLENSLFIENFKDESLQSIPKIPSFQLQKHKEKNLHLDNDMKIHSLECRIRELLKIQDTLIKNIEDNKISAIKNLQNEKKYNLELRDKLNQATSRISNLEDLLKNDEKVKLKKYIKELEVSRESLHQENQSLINRFQCIGKDLQSIEFQSKSMTEEILILKTQNSSLQNEIISLKAEKVENLKAIDGLSNEKIIKDQKVNELINTIGQLEERINDLKDLIQTISMNKYQEYSLKLDTSETTYRLLQLTKENEALKTQISSRQPTSQTAQGKKKLCTLEKLVDTMNLCSNIPKKRSKSAEKKYSSASSSKILRDLMTEIGLESPYGLIEVYKKISRENKLAAKAMELLDKIKDLVEKFSPPEAFKKSPSVKKVWKWVKKLADEFFRIKKVSENNEETLRAFGKIKSLVNTVSDEDSIQIIGKIIAENDHLKLLANKIKIVLRLNRKIPLSELEAEIDRRL